jgi:glutathione S-transferase
MTELTLFFAPHTCVLALFIALEEIGVPFDIKLVRLRALQQLSPEYL